MRNDAAKVLHGSCRKRDSRKAFAFHPRNWQARRCDFPGRIRNDWTPQIGIRYQRSNRTTPARQNVSGNSKRYGRLPGYGLQQAAPRRCRNQQKPPNRLDGGSSRRRHIALAALPHRCIVHQASQAIHGILKGLPFFRRSALLLGKHNLPFVYLMFRPQNAALYFCPVGFQHSGLIRFVPTIFVCQPAPPVAAD